MSTLRCSYCGGVLEIEKNSSVCTCKYCNSTNLLPKQLDKIGNRYDRARFLRQSCNFDKAILAYEEILRLDNTEADAHWGLVLSKFGIEYVSDPVSGLKVPTCHRIQDESILVDPEFLAAMDNADRRARRVLRTEAEKIDKIHQKIIKISQNEPSYDIFICYKDSDGEGNRTQDSVIAQDLFFQLQKGGYNVFFSRKTLSGKLGSEYEPIIFAALRSAKVMIVMGTKPEYLNAIWVRNEWTRFLKLAKGNEKVLIPAYRDMSAYDLPKELSNYQAQDMSRLGFMQDLTDGIDRIMRRPDTQVPLTTQSKTDESIKQLVRNGQTYIELGNYTAANLVYTTMTKEYPQNHLGWWGLIVCKTENFSKISFDQPMLNTWFGYVKQLSGGSDITELKRAYRHYTYRIAAADASKDMNSTKIKMDDYIRQINVLKKDISLTNETKSFEIQEFKQTVKNDKTLIAEKMERYHRIKRSRFIRRLLVLVCSFALCWALINYSNDQSYAPGASLASPEDSIALVGGLAVIGLCYFYKSAKMHSEKHGREMLIKAKDALTDVQNIKNKHKTIQENRIASLDGTIARNQKESDEIQAKVQDCNDYLALGDTEISKFWLSKELEKIEITATFDKKIEDMRNKVYHNHRDADADLISIACPICHVKFTRKKETVIKAGYTKCEACKNDIAMQA